MCSLSKHIFLNYANFRNGILDLYFGSSIPQSDGSQAATPVKITEDPSKPVVARISALNLPEEMYKIG